MVGIEATGEARGARLALGLFFGAACPASPFGAGACAFRRGGIVAKSHAPETRQLEHLAMSTQSLVSGLACA